MKDNNAVGPIFVLSSERSGTNLLRRRLTQGQCDVCGPPPIHILKHMFFAEPYYGDLYNDDNFIYFIKDSLGLAYHHFSPWDIHLTAREVLDAYPAIFGEARSCIGVMHTLYMLYAKRKGFNGYICKDNNLFDFASAIQLALPESKFIYLYRDPRDVIVSQAKRPLQNGSVANLSIIWKREQIKCIQIANSRTGSRVLKTVSYENLIANEEQVISGICNRFSLNQKGKKEADFSHEKIDVPEWENLNRPTMKDNKENYRKELTRGAIRKIESICWNQMNWLGYETLEQERPLFRNASINLEIGLSKIWQRLRRNKVASMALQSQTDRMRYIRILQGKWQ